MSRAAFVAAGFRRETIRRTATANTKFFLRGLITNLLNPKAGVFYLSIFPTFIDEARPLLPQTAILLTAYVTIATIIHSAVVVSASAIRPSIEERANTMLIGRIMSVLRAAVAIWLFYTTRRT
ncbi:LysE family translocator [Bradyrhizobium sp. USDA 4011]